MDFIFKIAPGADAPGREQDQTSQLDRSRSSVTRSKAIQQPQSDSIMRRACVEQAIFISLGDLEAAFEVVIDPI